MELFIRLAGVQLGPYSELQVRQHLDEGLLSPTDVARHSGTLEWAPLSEVLANLPQPDPNAAPVAAKSEEMEAPKPPADEDGPMQSPKRTDSSELTASSGLRDLDKKTVLLGPTAPVSRSPFGKAASSPATTSPLTQTHSTKKMERAAAVIKAIAQKTSPLPTKAIHPPPIRPPAEAKPETPAPETAPEGRKGGLPGLIKALTAKTVPMRSVQAPPLASASPFTAPMPTKSSFKPAAPSQSEPPENKSPGPDVPHSTEVSPAVDELEVPTVKIPPPSKLSEGKKAELPKEAPPSPKKSADETPKRPSRLLPILIGAWAALALFMIYYIWSPYRASAALQHALGEGDAAALTAEVDFPSVRDSLKDQVRAQLAQSGLDSSPSSVAQSMLDDSIDHYVTPESISALLNKSDTPSDQKADLSRFISQATAAKILIGFNAESLNSQGLATPFDFVMNRDMAMLHLQYDGLGWKLKQIDLQPGMATPGTAGAPLLAPVVDTFLERGSDKVKSGDQTGAIADFTQALAIDPRSSVAYENRAVARQSTQDVDGAIKDFTQALAFNAQLAPAYNGRGNAKLSQNNLDGAIADFTQAITLDPTLASAFDSRGNAKILKQDLDGAVADFTQAISLDPSLASAYSDRGFARQANGNLDGAIADYTQALALKPKMAGAYYNRGLARQLQGNLDAAIVDFNRAIEFDPKIADAYYFRGNAKADSHDLDGAIADYTQAISLNPKKAVAYGNRGLTLQQKGDLDGAMADFTSALALDPKITSAYLNRAVIESQKNDLDNAIADSTQAIYLDAKNPQSYSVRGIAKLIKGNLDGAAADLNQFCELAPRDHNADHARLYLWLIAKAQNSGADADQTLSSALESNWNSTPDDLVTKTAEFFLGQLPEADYLAAAASLDAKTDQSQHCQAWYFAGMKRLLTGDKKGAIQAFQQCIATGQKDFSEYSLAQAELQSLLLPIGPKSAKPVAPAKPPVPKQ